MSGRPFPKIESVARDVVDAFTNIPEWEDRGDLIQQVANLRDMCADHPKRFGKLLAELCEQWLEARDLEAEEAERDADRTPGFQPIQDGEWSAETRRWLSRPGVFGCGIPPTPR